MRITWTDHLVRLVGRAEAAGARLAGAPAEGRAALARAARRQIARLSARLDASPLTDETADEVDAREDAGLPQVVDVVRPEADTAGGWARALRLEGMATQEVAAVEYANLLACVDLEPVLAADVLSEPLAVLARLHGEICRGLVDPEVIGRPRRTDQAVADGAQGRLLYRGADPRTIPGLLAELGEWVTRDGARLPALVVAGVVHERLLQWQPFEAGNGRLARAASRVLLRAHGLDAHGVAIPERTFAADPVGYFAEVAATLRRRGDVSLWLERYGEALAAALESAANALVPATAPAPAARAAEVAQGMEPGETLTVPEYVERAGVSAATAQVDLDRLVAAGRLGVEPRSRGLRYRRLSDQTI